VARRYHLDAMLEAIAPSLWSVTHSLHLRGVRLPTRMSAVRLPGGELLLHSPVPIDDALAAELDALGPVRWIVAPTLLHDRFVGQALQRYPAARLHAAPGFAAAHPALPAAETLTDEAPPAWRGVIDQRLIRGAPRVNEVVFLHRPSATLIVSDLVFNVQRPEGWMTALMLRTFGTYKRLGQSRLWRVLARDRAAMRESLGPVLAWPFERVLPGHGDPVTEDARASMARALWILKKPALSSKHV
jgi:hypothetical protein